MFSDKVILVLYFGVVFFEGSINGDFDFVYNERSPNASCIIQNSGLPGTCVPFSKCKNAQETLKNHKIRPDICHLQAREPFVCCSDIISNQINIFDFLRCRKNIIQCHKAPTNNEYFRTECWEKECNKQSEDFKYDFTLCRPLFALNALPTKIGDFPFMGAIGWRQNGGGIFYNCGGFLLTPKYVLTAAHCTDFGGDPPAVVRTGGIDLDNKTRNDLDIPIQSVYVHPLYKSTEVYNDIAIIKLARSSPDTPKCISDKGYDSIEGISTIFVGYGQTSFAGQSSNKLLQIELTVINNDKCKEYYPPNEFLPRGIMESQICAMDTKKDSNQDTCQGDSGGPLLTFENEKPKILGITSFGQSCGSPAPGIYTNVLYYLDWIESIVWNNVK